MHLIHYDELGKYMRYIIALSLFPSFDFFVCLCLTAPALLLSLSGSARPSVSLVMKTSSPSLSSNTAVVPHWSLSHVVPWWYRIQFALSFRIIRQINWKNYRHQTFRRMNRKEHIQSHYHEWYTSMQMISVPRMLARTSSDLHRVRRCI